MREFIVSYFSKKGYDKKVCQSGQKIVLVQYILFKVKMRMRCFLYWVVQIKVKDNELGGKRKANILNVACTRAKYRIAFIGNINDWKDKKYFEDFITDLIDIIQ